MSGKDTGPPPDLPIPVAPPVSARKSGRWRIHDLMQRSLRIKNTLFLFRTGIAMGEKRKPDTKTKNWIEGAFNKQGMISIESGLDKVQDFAMEFLFRRARYCPLRGIIRFQYRGARLLYRQHPRGTIHHALSHHPIHGRRNLFPHPRGGMRCITRSVRIYICGLYRGVDMLVYRQKRMDLSLFIPALRSICGTRWEWSLYVYSSSM